MNIEVLEMKIEAMEKRMDKADDKIEECMDLKSALLLLTQSVQKLDKTVDGLLIDKERKFNNIDALKYLTIGAIITGVVGFIMKTVFNV